MPVPPVAAEPAGAAPLDADRWVDDHGDALLRFALSRGLDVASAEDAVQETLLAAWRGRERFLGGCSVRTWLVAILKRRIADHYRRGASAGRSKGEPAGHGPPPPTHAPPPDEAVEGAEFWSVLTGCTEKLPAHLNRAFTLRSLSSEPIATVCEQEGVSRENLSVRLCRARTLLRRCLERHWYGDP